MSYEKVLVVDDEEHIVELIKFNLESNGYKVVTSYDGNSAIDLLKREKVDIIVLDLMLPGIDGVEVCKILRSEKDTKKIPIIMLTAKSDEMDKILGLEIGADDYMTKPFSVRELIARIRAVLRRSVEDDGNIPNMIQIRDIIIDIEKHVVTKNNEELDLTLKEFDLLKLLAENRGKVLSRNHLLDKIWGYNYFGETRTVDVHIRHLRKKIENDDKSYDYIETIRGIGYKMK